MIRQELTIGSTGTYFIVLHREDCPSALARPDASTFPAWTSAMRAWLDEGAPVDAEITICDLDVRVISACPRCVGPDPEAATAAAREFIETRERRNAAQRAAERRRQDHADTTERIRREATRILLDRHPREYAAIINELWERE